MIKYGLMAFLIICSTSINTNPGSGVFMQILKICATRSTGISQRVRAYSVKKDAGGSFDSHRLKVLSEEEKQLNNKLSEIQKSIARFAEIGNSGTLMNRSRASSVMDDWINEKKAITDRLSSISKDKALLKQQKEDQEYTTLFKTFDELSNKEQNIGKVLAIKDIEICQCDDLQEHVACVIEEQRLHEGLSNTRLEKATIMDSFLQLSENAERSEMQKIMHEIVYITKQIAQIRQYQDTLTKRLNTSFAVIPDNNKEEFLNTITRINDLTNQCALLKEKLSTFKKG